MPADAILTDASSLLRDLQADASIVCFLDVRTASEYETEHIPGSRHVPLDQLGSLRAELAQLPGVVVLCQSGGRARQAARELAAAGASGVRVLDGGIGAWVAAGGDTNHGRQRWALERQVRLVAGSLVLAGVLGSVAVPRLKWLAGGVGAGLTFAAVTDTCAMGNLLGRLPYNRGGSWTAGGALCRIGGGRQD